MTLDLYHISPIYSCVQLFVSVTWHQSTNVSRFVSFTYHQSPVCLFHTSPIPCLSLSHNTNPLFISLTRHKSTVYLSHTAPIHCLSLSHITNPLFISITHHRSNVYLYHTSPIQVVSLFHTSLHCVPQILSSNIITLHKDLQGQL